MSSFFGQLVNQNVALKGAAQLSAPDALDPTTVDNDVTLLAKNNQRIKALGGAGGAGGSFTPTHTQAIRNASWTWGEAAAIPWTGVNWDTDTKWASGNPTRLTILTAGYYYVTAQLDWIVPGSPTAGSLMQTTVNVNGFAGMRIGHQMWINGNANPNSQLISGVLKLNAADYLELYVNTLFGTHPTNLALTTGATGPNGPLFQLDYMGT